MDRKESFFLSYRTLGTNFILTQLITYAFCINITCLTARGNAVCFDPTGGRLYPNLERWEAIGLFIKKKSRFFLKSAPQILTGQPLHELKICSVECTVDIFLFRQYQSPCPIPELGRNYFWREKLINRYPTADRPIAALSALIRSLVTVATGVSQRRMNWNQVTMVRAEIDIAVTVNGSSAISQHLLKSELISMFGQMTAHFLRPRWLGLNWTSWRVHHTSWFVDGLVRSRNQNAGSRPLWRVR